RAMPSSVLHERRRRQGPSYAHELRPVRAELVAAAGVVLRDVDDVAGSVAEAVDLGVAVAAGVEADPVHGERVGVGPGRVRHLLDVVGEQSAGVVELVEHGPQRLVAAPVVVDGDEGFGTDHGGDLLRVEGLGHWTASARVTVGQASHTASHAASTSDTPVSERSSAATSLRRMWSCASGLPPPAAMAS